MSHHDEDRDHTELRDLLGPYLLGGIDAEDRVALQAHLVTCSACRDELATYAGLPALLRAGTAATSPPASDTGLADAVGALRVVRRTRRRRPLLAAAAAVVLLCGIGLGVATLGGNDETVTPSATTYALTAAGGATSTGSTSLTAKPWGTAVDLTLDGLPQDERFVAWMVSPDGERQQVATWGSTATGAARVTGAGALPPDQVVEVAVTTAEGDLVLSTATS